MKTKTFFILCLLFGIGLTQLAAQFPDPPKNGTGSVNGTQVWDWGELSWPVYCNDEQVDLLIGSGTYHFELHFKDGTPVWIHSICFGNAVSIGFIDENGNKIGGTGESFRIHEVDQRTLLVSEYGTLKWNFRGENGTHYVATVLFSNITWNFTSVRAVCPGNDK